MQSLQKFKTYEEYLKHNKISLFHKPQEEAPTSQTTNTEHEKESWFSGWHKQATSPKFDTDIDLNTNMMGGPCSTTNKKTSKK